MDLKQLIRSILPEALAEILKDNFSDFGDAMGWIAYKRSSRVPPPHIVKVKTVIEYARHHGIQVLIETGTFEGEMVRKCSRQFREIYTIELDEQLACRAARRLAKYRNIQVIHGDSSQCLLALLASIKEPVIFWLDAHYSGGITAKAEEETPLLKELEAIRRHRITDHVILIDDARLLGQGDYPNEGELVKKLLQINSRYKIEIVADIMRCEAN